MEKNCLKIFTLKKIPIFKNLIDSQIFLDNLKKKLIRLLVKVTEVTTNIKNNLRYAIKKKHKKFFFLPEGPKKPWP